MPGEDKKRFIHRALVDRVRHGPGRSPADQRTRAFDHAAVPEALHRLLDKAAANSSQITDADYVVAMEAGFTGDQLFELVICAAVGEATRQYDAGLTALAEATGGGEAA